MKLNELHEAVAGPIKKFKKGQRVTVKKTGKEVVVLSQDEIGMVFTATDEADFDSKSKVAASKGFKEYMPSELQEGWKEKAAAGALAGAVALGANASGAGGSIGAAVAKGAVGAVAAKVVDADSREADEAFMAKIPAGPDRDAYKSSMTKMRVFRAMSISKPSQMFAAKIAKKKHKALHDELAAKYKLNEGWFSKKEPKIDRQPIDDEEREMISRAFDFGHNAKLKRGNEYVLPDNVALNYRKARVNFYKDGSKLMASVGYYSDEDGPGNPKKSPAKTVDRQIKGKEDLYNLKDELDGTASSSISSSDLKHAEMKKDQGR